MSCGCQVTELLHKRPWESGVNCNKKVSEFTSRKRQHVGLSQVCMSQFISNFSENYLLKVDLVLVTSMGLRFDSHALGLPSKCVHI